jgi:hypothetical protein
MWGWIIGAIIPFIFSAHSYAYEIMLYCDNPIPENQNITVITYYDAPQFQIFYTRVYLSSAKSILYQVYSDLSHVVGSHQLALLWAKNYHLQTKLDEHHRVTQEGFTRIETVIIQQQILIERQKLQKKKDDELYDPEEKE